MDAIKAEMNLRETTMMNKTLKVLFSDIDGTLTDGRLYYGINGEVMKTFHVKDGAGIKNWMSKGFEFGVISARSSEIISVRMKELNVTEIITGAGNKESILEDWLKLHGYTWENLCYIGDDINDLPVIKRAGFSAAPADAISVVLQAVNFCCETPGGMGAVREFIDFLLDDTHTT
ncbi:MAG: HAD-IIIA family hydrolase [Spirochaetia bacterium]|nr:HAD-IIIA family hydrolase [Spirochaetia bacterium]